MMGPARAAANKLFVCRNEHPNDVVYAENLAEFFRGQGIELEIIGLVSQGPREQLLRCLDEPAIGVLGINTLLDHSWIDSKNFLDLAARAGLPVIHWVLDHPSSRWPQFTQATAANSRFVFLSRFSEQYFQHYGLPGSLTATTTNTGVSQHSRVAHLTREDFGWRRYKCLIAMNLRRIGGTLEDAIARRDALAPHLAEAVQRAIDAAYFDLDLPIETHLVAALADAAATLGNDRFNHCLQIAEEVVQIRRRQWIFDVAREFPVLIQSDAAARPFAAGGSADFEVDVDMRTTFSRMRSARAVLNVSHVNDEIHNRTLNGLNAGCANIVEDNVVHRRLLRDGENALFFRYGDDSLRRCLDLVCGDADAAYRIGESGFALRDCQPFRFGGFDNFVKLAHTPLPEAAALRPVPA